jgi:endonuclease/exonuclease/phosphatase family metal-dependent hydrolase
MKIKYQSDNILNRRLNPSVSVLLIALALFNAINVFGQDAPIRVMTFNIRYDNPEDGINRWDNRKQAVSEAIIKQDNDLAGLQEVLINQLNDLDGLLPGYGHVGVGREDGKTKGEYAPIFYKTDRFGLLDQGTFWLSPAPLDTGSIGWDAALTRICTWGKFQDKTSGLEFYFLNTHFDHMGDTARVESARLIVDFINRETNSLPVILTGDFNSSPAEDPYSVLANPENGLSDVCQLTNSSKACNEGTFNGFGSEKDTQRIDMVFIKGRWEVGSYKVLKIKDGNVFISDHWPVVVELKVQNSKFKIK